MNDCTSSWCGLCTSTGIGNGIAKELDLFRLGPGLARNAKLGHWSRSSDLAKKTAQRVRGTCLWAAGCVRMAVLVSISLRRLIGAVCCPHPQALHFGGWGALARERCSIANATAIAANCHLGKNLRETGVDKAGIEPTILTNWV